MDYDLTRPCPLSPDEIYNVNDPDRSSSLWCTVLRRATCDLYLPADHKYNSLNWWLSSSVEIGSSCWICYEIGISRQAVIERHATRIRTLLHARLV